MITLEIWRSVVGWCAIINTAILLWWAFWIKFAPNWVYRIHRRWIAIDRQTFDRIHYAGMAAFKLGIIFFNIVPYLAFRIV